MSMPDMSAYEPTQNEARAHSMVVGAVGHLINLTGAYLSSPDGSDEERDREQELGAAITTMTDGNLFASDLLLCFASLVVATCPEDKAQEWFDTQAQKIAETLGLEL